jgi:hypothetical protein
MLHFDPVLVYAAVIINKEYGETQKNEDKKLRYDNLDIEKDLAIVM